MHQSKLSAPLATKVALGRSAEDIGPSVAVIVIGRNTAKFLDECLASVFAQTVKPNEIVYVDDASEDKSLEIAQGFEPRGLRIISLDTRRGMCGARMVGVQFTTAQLLLFVDSDNVLPPDYIAPMIEEIGNFDFVYTSRDFIGEGDALKNRLAQHPSGRSDAPTADRSKLWRENYADTCSLVRRDAFFAAGAWRDNPADTMFDWDLFLRMSARGGHARSRARLRYRVHEENWSMRERGQRIRLNGLVRRYAATVTVGSVWSGRLPDLATSWLEAIMTSLILAGKTGSELLILDDSAEGFPMPVNLRELCGNGAPFSAVNVRRIHRGIASQERRPNRRSTAEFLSAACNDILRLASGDAIWFIEDDVIVPPLAADTLLRELLQADGAPHTAVAGCYRSRHRDDEWVACNVKDNRVVHLSEQPTETIPVQMTGTGCIMILRDLLKGIRFGSEWRHQHLRTTGHDWNFAWQLHKRGTPVRLIHSVVCRHHTSLHQWL